MSTEQKQVFTGMLAALAVTAVVLGLTYWLSQTGYDRIRLSAPAASALVCLALAFSIATIARKRFFDSEIIGGAGYDRPGSPVAVDRAVLQNTVEQSVLAVAAYQGLASVAPTAAGALLPALAALFLAGRALFVARYRKGAGARAFGFALTFYPTMVALAIVAVLLVARL